MQLRCRLPADSSISNTVVELRLTDSSWTAVDAQQQGSYLVITLPKGVTGLRLYHMQEDILPYIIVAASLLLVLTITVITVVIFRKRKK